MSFLLRDKDSGLYIGSHRHDFAKLQELDYAVTLESQSKAEESLDELKNLPLDLEITEKHATRRNNERISGAMGRDGTA